MRYRFVIAVAVTIAAGLGSRAVHAPKEIGDALYATMVFFILRCFGVRRWPAAAVALAFSCAIEFSQLAHADWLDAARATLPGRLVLGQGFHATDLLAYVAGVALGVAIPLHVAPDVA